MSQNKILFLFIFVFSQFAWSYPLPCTHYLGRTFLDNVYIDVNSKGELTFLPKVPDLLKPLDLISKRRQLQYGINELTEGLSKVKNIDLNQKDSYFRQMTDLYGVGTKTQNEINIPKSGPTVFFANHPFSGIDGLAIASVIEKYRKDVKVVAMNVAIQGMKGFKDRFIPVYPSIPIVTGKKVNKNMIKEMYDHVKDGGALLIFPAGGISRWISHKQKIVMDKPWFKGFAKIKNLVKDASYVPVFVEGEPNKEFLDATLDGKWLESYTRMFQEMGRLRGKDISLIFGDKIPAQKVNRIKNINKQASYLRAELYSLGTSFFYKRYTKEQAMYDEAFPYLSKEEFDLLYKAEIELNPSFSKEF